MGVNSEKLHKHIRALLGMTLSIPLGSLGGGCGKEKYFILPTVVSAGYIYFCIYHHETDCWNWLLVDVNVFTLSSMHLSWCFLWL